MDPWAEKRRREALLRALHVNNGSTGMGPESPNFDAENMRTDRGIAGAMQKSLPNLMRNIANTPPSKNFQFIEGSRDKNWPTQTSSDEEFDKQLIERAAREKSGEFNGPLPGSLPSVPLYQSAPPTPQNNGSTGMDPELQRILFEAATKLGIPPPTLQSSLLTHTQQAQRALSAAQVSQQNIQRLTEAAVRNSTGAMQPVRPIPTNNYQTMGEARARVAAREAARPTPQSARPGPIMSFDPPGSGRLAGGKAKVDYDKINPPPSWKRLATDPVPAPANPYNMVRPELETPQPMPPPQTYGPEDAGVMPDTEPPGVQGTGGRPGTQSKNKFQGQLAPGTGTPPPFEEDNLWDRMLGPKTDRNPDWKPGKVATWIGQATGISPTSVAKGAGAFGKALGLMSLFSGGGGSSPPPIPDQPPSPDFAGAVQQKRKEAEAMPADEQEPAPMDLASYTAKEIARLKKRRQALGYGGQGLLG